MNEFDVVPPLEVSEWLNTPKPITLADLRGRVVLLHTFQMLCPACVSHGLPQTSKAREMFAEHDLAVIGLHTVFEHHSAMDANALRAFVHEYRLAFPIGIDKPGKANLPQTMEAYGLRGTPSLLLLDQAGRLRLHHFGRIDDMALGALIGQLIAQGEPAPVQDGSPQA